MRHTGRRGRSQGILRFMLVFGAVVGAATGYVEGVAMMRTGRTMMSAGGVVDLALLYAVIFAVVGLALGLIAWGATLVRRRPDPGREKRRFAALLVSLTVFVVAVGYANELFLPEFTSRKAILVDGALLVACLALWLALFRRLESGARRGARARAPWLTIAAIAAAALIAATAIPELARPGESEEVSARETGKPNVLLLVVDALRADHVGLYGYERDTTPNLDRLASGGVAFTRAYAQGCRTKETTASIVTSLYATTHGVSRLPDAIPAQCTTVIDLFRRGGYRTALFSANPLVSPAFGFGNGADRVYCDVPPTIRQAIVPIILTKLTPLVRGVRALRDAERKLDRALPFSRRTVAFEDGSAEDLDEKLLEWIDSDEGSFFAYVHYMEPHVPYAPPPPYDRMFDPDFDGERLTRPPGQPGLSPFTQDRSLAPRLLENLVAQYDGSIASFDAELGRLVQELESRDLADRTLVVVTADHGEEFLDHGAWAHGHSLYEELIRVPLVVWGHPALDVPRVIEEPVRHVDLMPTMLAAAGLGVADLRPPPVGADLWPALVGLADFDPGVTPMAELLRGGLTARSLLVGNAKLIHVDRGAEEEFYLFDLSDDPDERRDISADDPQTVREMLGRLEAIGLEQESVPVRPASQSMDESTREKLEALGYTM